MEKVLKLGKNVFKEYCNDNNLDYDENQPKKINGEVHIFRIDKDGNLVGASVKGIEFELGTTTPLPSTPYEWKLIKELPIKRDKNYIYWIDRHMDVSRTRRAGT